MMKNRFIGWMIAAAAVTIVFSLGWSLATISVRWQAAAAAVQAAIPRTTDGKPDLSGVWQALNSAHWNIEDHHAQLFRGLPPRFGIAAGQTVVEGDAIPYQPWALKKRQENYANSEAADSEANCFQPGVPRITYMPYPFQIFQTPKQVSIIYEYQHATRNIFMDGTRLEGPIEWWMGDSRGRWEGDTLVVDVAHFSDRTWFDRVGNFHSEALHVVERYSLMDRDHISYEATIEDPKVFTRPWTMRMPLYRRVEPNARLLEFECHTFVDESVHGN